MRKKKQSRCLLAFLLAVCILITGSVSTSFAADVVPSKEEYTLSFKGVTEAFFGNAKTVDAKAGTEVYLTYTVDKVREGHDAIQHGVLGTDQPDLRYPYTEGGILHYSEEAPLLKQGYTYFMKFTYTEEGMEYVIAAVNEKEESEWIFLNRTVEAGTDDFTNFGVWLAGTNVSVRLTHVRCYDQKGNDLGVFAPNHKESLMDNATVRENDTKIDHRYDITIENGVNIVLGNAKETTSDTIYMEYTVKESSDTKIYQTGLMNHRAPRKNYPHAGTGYLLYEMDVDNRGTQYLLQEGASYIITFQRKENALLTLIQKTYNGQVEFHEFTNFVGEYTYGDPYLALWFGEGPECFVNCELIDFKCYDGNNNNLGVQTNDSKDAVKIVHRGEMEDYSGCEAMYYNAEHKNIIALYADKTAKVTRDGETENITYKIKDDVLTLEFANKTETYEYFYKRFTDAEGNMYVRLGTYYVNFVTGTDEKIDTLTVNAQGGYTIAIPEEPKKEGADFLGWYLSDGTEFDFGEIIDESKTLYAKWSDDPNFKIAKAGSFGLDNIAPIVAIAASVVVLAAGVVGGVVVLKKGKKGIKTDENKKTI